jgi:uncharacterized protein YqjF (DUF2071 family)
MRTSAIFESITSGERLAMRSRPPGSPLMSQKWDNLLFLHWPIEPMLLRPLIPESLEIDTFEGSAWIGITPFAATNLRLMSLPPLPGFASFLELNVRTYVHYRGKPGVWFFSLDASKAIPATAARLLYTLPYFKAEMYMEQEADYFSFASTRSTDSRADFRARWLPGLKMRDPDVESLAFYLVERYALFVANDDTVNMARVYHHPWILHEAVVTDFESSMIDILGLPEPTSPPLVHFSPSLNVEIWPLATPG